MSSLSAGLGTYRSPGKVEMVTANSKEAQQLLLGNGTGHLPSHFLDQSASRPSLMGCGCDPPVGTDGGGGSKGVTLIRSLLAAIRTHRQRHPWSSSEPSKASMESHDLKPWTRPSRLSEFPRVMTQ